MVLSLTLSSPHATETLASALAHKVRAGDTILLEGPVGAGKTAFSRALIQALQRNAGQPVEDVPSPTFTLVQTYEAGALGIWHCDLYRLTDPDEVLELGLEDAWATDLCLIEWPDRLGADVPPSAMTFAFAHCEDPDHRHLTITHLAQHLRPTLEAFHD